VGQAKKRYLVAALEIRELKRDNRFDPILFIFPSAKKLTDPLEVILAPNPFS